MMNYLYALTTLLTSKRDDERGATAVEYGLLVVLIAAVIIGTVVLVGNDVLAGFEGVEDQMGGSQN